MSVNDLTPLLRVFGRVLALIEGSDRNSGVLMNTDLDIMVLLTYHWDIYEDLSFMRNVDNDES